MPNKIKKRKMGSKNLSEGLSQPGQEEAIKIVPITTKDDQKIEVEIGLLIRIRANELEALKNSLEAWGQQWD